MDTRLIATVPVARKIVPRFQESAAEADLRDDRLQQLSELDRARLIAGLGNALGAIEEAEKVPGVMSSPQNQMASLLQSMIVEHATDAEPLPVGNALEAKFDTHDWLGWLGTFWEMVKHAKKFPWRDPAPLQRVAQFDKSSPRLAVFADWGTGLYGAPLIAKSIAADPDPIDLVMHLGDVYYSGKKDEFNARFSELWPSRADALSRALNGNHEMYCGGQPLVDVLAAKPFQQSTTCFAYENDHWIIVGLDTAYADHDLMAPQTQWLTDIAAAAAGRRIVLFSHHQPFSMLSGQGPKLVEKLGTLLQGRKIFAWYWGHEHECVIYDQHPGWQMYGRCIGHAGMPEFRPKPLGPAVPTRQFRRFEGANGVPGAWILDGPNPYIEGEEKKFTPHGYLTLVFEPGTIVETVHDADGTLIRTQELA
jgi:calcineurin-like phosphoesterase family protein